MSVMVMGHHVMARRHLIFPRGNNFADYTVRCHRGVRVSKTPRMDSESKRPTCPSCAKPTQLCLCKRMRSPCLDNKVSVTVLQHSLERKHALNSTRIARLGLQNVNVATVFDVHSEAEFVISAIPSGRDEIDSNRSDSDCRLLENRTSLEVGYSLKFSFDNVEKLESDNNVVQISESLRLSPSSGEVSGRVSRVSDDLGCTNAENLESENNVVLVDDGSLGIAESVSLSRHSGEVSSQDSRVSVCCEESRSKDLFKISIGRRGVIRNVSHSLMIETDVEGTSFDHILASEAAMDVLAKGFVVTKFSEGKKEFELEVPSGSALLFPSEESVKIVDLKEKDLKVKNLIVLDGTWSKARRMYLENPWLKLLCCDVKLEIEGTSLYKEVRRQPRSGCLSTLESIVYAMKELDEDPDCLDNMLNVFESMVEDQRRCKDENLEKII